MRSSTVPNRFTSEFAYQEALKLGIDRDTYLKRIQTTSAWDHIKANIAQGQQLGVSSTPTVYVDGRLLKGWGDRHLWEYMFSDETLAATTQPTTRPASSQTQEE